MKSPTADQLEPKGPPSVPLKAEQKIVSRVKAGLAKLDDQGGIRIDLSVPASALVLGRLLGKGSFGMVYEGVYQGKSVAIKQLSGHLGADALIELKHEAAIMFQLGVSSEYIVKLIKICLETPYSLVMELMPQGSLYEMLHNGKDFPWQIRYQIAADAAQGLSDLHEHKILHRDLKSLNILLRNGRAKLADFGLAKVKHETSSQSSVSHGKVGTLLWMAPELFDDEPKVTTASDIYSFGMVLWELVTRQLPYAKWRPEVAGIRIAQGKKEEIPSDCPPALKKIIESCWQTPPVRRPTAVGVLADLKPLVEQKVPPKTAQKTSTPDKSPKSPLPLPSVSQNIAQTILPPPKPAVNLELQEQLISACKRGDKNTVIELLKQGAKPNMPNAKGEQPLGAAVWGMCDDVVWALLNEAKGAPMTWGECEQHNLRHYKEVFMVMAFNPKTGYELSDLLRKIICNSYLSKIYMDKLYEEGLRTRSLDTPYLNDILCLSERFTIYGVGLTDTGYDTGKWGKAHARVAGWYELSRAEIKREVERASRPTMGKNF